MHVERLAQDAGVISRARQLGVARAVASVVFARIVERPVGAQEAEHAVAIFGRHLSIKRALLHALHQQLADVAAGIVDGLAHNDGLAAVGGIVLQEGGVGHVDLNLQLYAELFAVAKDSRMDGGETGRTEVLVVAGLPRTGLGAAVEEDDLVTAAHAVVAPSRTLASLEHRNVVAERAQLVGGDQAGDAAAEHDHLDAFAGAGGRLHRLRPGRVSLHQTHALHRQEGSAVPACLPNPAQKIASRDPHWMDPPEDFGVVRLRGVRVPSRRYSHSFASDSLTLVQARARG